MFIFTFELYKKFSNSYVSDYVFCSHPVPPCQPIHCNSLSLEVCKGGDQSHVFLIMEASRNVDYNICWIGLVLEKASWPRLNGPRYVDQDMLCFDNITGHHFIDNCVRFTYEEYFGYHI